MIKRYLGDGGPTWTEDLGGDGITRRTITHYGPESGGKGLRDQLRAYAEGFFRRRLEDILSDCDVVLAEHGWLREQNGKRVFPGDRDCQPYSDLWYAGRIGDLCWFSLRYEEMLSGEIGLQRAMAIGGLYTEWEWRHTHRPSILMAAKVRGGAKKAVGARRGVREDTTRRVLDAMDRLIAEGHKIQTAAAITYRKGIGASTKANRQAWYRYRHKKL